jgi:hypothetical protein
MDFEDSIVKKVIGQYLLSEIDFLIAETSIGSPKVVPVP